MGRRYGISLQVDRGLGVLVVLAPPSRGRARIESDSEPTYLGTLGRPCRGALCYLGSCRPPGFSDQHISSAHMRNRSVGVRPPRGHGRRGRRSEPFDPKNPVGVEEGFRESPPSPWKPLMPLAKAQGNHPRTVVCADLQKREQKQLEIAYNEAMQASPPRICLHLRITTMPESALAQVRVYGALRIIFRSKSSPPVKLHPLRLDLSVTRRFRHSDALKHC
jgi:hypothetical protein